MVNGISFDDEPDLLSALLHDSSINRRQDIWLWLHLHLRRRLLLNPNTCNGTTMREAIAGDLRHWPNLIKKVPYWKDEYLVQDERLAWITDDERQHLWLSPRVDDLTDKYFPRGLVHLTGRHRIIAMIDAWHVDIRKKAREIEHLREQWRRHLARDSQLEWFADNKEGTKRCICAWEWIKKHRPTPRQLPINNYQELLAFFDKENLLSYEQKVIIQEIKKRWNRQRFDDRNADKKQINVMLSKTVIAQLDELAKRHDLKRAQVIEALVGTEAEIGDYLAGA